MSDPTRSPARRLRLFLRDFRMLEASVSLADGQSLTSFLSSRKSYLHLQDAHWSNTGERAGFAVLRVAQLLWVGAADGSIPLVASSMAAGVRVMEVQVDGGLLVRAGFYMGEHQRLGDYLEAAGSFIPLHAAQLLRSGRPAKRVNLVLGDVVLNQDAIQAVWESSVGREEIEYGAGDAPTWGLPELTLTAAGVSGGAASHDNGSESLRPADEGGGAEPEAEDPIAFP